MTQVRGRFTIAPSRAVHAARISPIETDATSRPSAWTLTCASAVTEPMSPTGTPVMMRRHCPRSAGATLTRNREGVSQNSSRSCSLPVSPGNGKGIKGDPRPSSPPRQLSARATHRPPSERSWQERTHPARMARCSFR